MSTLQWKRTCTRSLEWQIEKLIERHRQIDEVIAAVLQVIVIQTGRGLVRLISLGKWRGMSLFSDEGKIYAAGAFSYVRADERVITNSGLPLARGIFYLDLLAAMIVVAAVA